MKNSYNFFQNKKCEFFPCHNVSSTESFSCLMCFCPLYNHDDCGGDYVMFGDIKDCSNCIKPHYDYNYIIDRLTDKKGKRMNKIRGFEVVRDDMRKTVGEITLPTRGSSTAMAYDFYANEDYVAYTNEILKVWTDVKAYMRQDECLIINVRSSMGGKFMLANTSGWIDSDYYSNESNDGNIGIFLKNISDKDIIIHKGDRIAQGAFFNFLVADNGNTDSIRTGGFGSTNN